MRTIAGAARRRDAGRLCSRKHASVPMASLYPRRIGRGHWCCRPSTMITIRPPRASRVSSISPRDLILSTVCLLCLATNPVTVSSRLVCSLDGYPRGFFARRPTASSCWQHTPYLPVKLARHDLSLSLSLLFFSFCIHDTTVCCKFMT